MLKKIVLIIFLYTLITMMSNFLLDTETLVYDFYSDKLSDKEIYNLIENQKKLKWLPFVILPLIIMLRNSLVALSLNIGVFFYDMESKISYKKLFNVALTGEFVLVLVGCFKIVYFLFIKTDYTLQDIQQYYPLSYTSFLDIENIESWLIYPLQTINLFEIGYFFVLVYGVHKLLKNKYLKSFEITAISYGTGLTIWIGLVMFLTLNMS